MDLPIKNGGSFQIATKVNIRFKACGASTNQPLPFSPAPPSAPWTNWGWGDRMGWVKNRLEILMEKNPQRLGGNGNMMKLGGCFSQMGAMKNLRIFFCPESRSEVENRPCINGLMWETQCRKQLPWLGMVNKPPIKTVTWGMAYGIGFTTLVRPFKSACLNYWPLSNLGCSK